MSEQTWRIRVPYAGEWLTSNRSSRYRHGARDWRHATHVACKAAKLPLGITPVRIHAVAYYVGRSPVRDRMNLYPTVKACIDGLVPQRMSTRNGRPHLRGGYGLLPDDSDRHVLGTTWDIMPSDDIRPYVVLEITHKKPAEATA